MKYNFNNINDEEFEELFKDILTLKLGKKFRTFRKGKDGGIDVISIDDSNIIGQAKHYLESSSAKLLYDLEHIEKEKVKKLKPKRYIFCCSRKLSRGEFEKVLEIFSPFIRSNEDIFDENIIVDILEKNQELENKWYKLWMPEPNVIKKILNSLDTVSTSYYEEKINKEIRVYTETKYYKKAEKLLDENNVIIIHGNPGTGKTTLANMLVYKLITRDYRFKYLTSNNIQNLDFLLKSDEKNVILVDDFLGGNILEIEAGKENDISNLINICSNSKNKKLILTTRTVLYNRANKDFEKFNRITTKTNKLKIDTSEMSLYEKAKLLYNHICYRNINFSPKYEVFLKNNLYYKIINSINYTPRNISEIIDNIVNYEKDEVENIRMIEFALKDTNGIWKYYYKNLRIEEKMLLQLIAMFNSDVQLNVVEKIFNKLYNELLKEKNIQWFDNCFEESIKVLSESLIKIVNIDIGEALTNLSNPSIRDYVIDTIKNNGIIFSITKGMYIEQLIFLYKIVNNEVKEKIIEIIIYNYEDIDSLDNKEQKIFNFLIENRIDDKLIRKIFKALFSSTNIKLTNQTVKNILKILKSDNCYFKRIFVIFEYKYNINNLLKNIREKEDLDNYIEIFNDIFLYDYWIEHLESELESAIEQCYDTELANSDDILNEFVYDDINNREKIEEKLTILYLEKAENYLKSFSDNIRKLISPNISGEKLFTKGGLEYEDIYEYWFEPVDIEENDYFEKTEQQLIKEMFEKK